jgi:serine/threonine protein phosphatase 1
MPSTLIIGDIHACYFEMLDLLEKAGIGDDDLVVSVGDIVDRGPEPREVIEFFRNRKNSIVIIGNHERKHIRNVLSYSQQVAKLQIGESYDDHVRWLATLPYYWERDDVRVVHWGHFPGTPLADVPEEVLAGTASGDNQLKERYGDKPWYDFYTEDKPVVFGHSVVGSEPLVIRDRIFGLDTGACHGMRLTGLLLPEMHIVSVPARSDHWAKVRQDWQAPVLRTLPWSTMTFEQIEKKIKSLRDPELDREVLDQVTGWAASLRAEIPQLREKLDAEVARITAEAGADFGRAAANHPAASWLHRWQTGRLSREHLGCGSPQQLVTLAKALGTALPENPL